MASNQYDSQASTNYKEAFALFDKRGNGRVQHDSLGDLLRACGQNPTLSEIQDLQKNMGNDCEYSEKQNTPPVMRRCERFLRMATHAGGRAAGGKQKVPKY